MARVISSAEDLGALYQRHVARVVILQMSLINDCADLIDVDRSSGGRIVVNTWLTPEVGSMVKMPPVGRVLSNYRDSAKGR